MGIGKQRRFNIETGLDPDVLDHIREQLLDWIKEAGVSEEAQTGLHMIFEELVTNIMEHSQAEWLELAVMMSEDGVLMSLADNGAEFNPREKFERSKEIPRMQVYRSLGLGMVMNLSRYFYYLRDPKGINRTFIEVPNRPDDLDPA